MSSADQRPGVPGRRQEPGPLPSPEQWARWLGGLLYVVEWLIRRALAAIAAAVILWLMIGMPRPR